MMQKYKTQRSVASVRAGKLLKAVQFTDDTNETVNDGDTVQHNRDTRKVES